MILPEYAFMSGWLGLLKNNKPLPYKNFYFIGGRKSGKTLALVNFAWYTLLTAHKSVAWYFVRKVKVNKSEMMGTILSETPQGLNVQLNLNNNQIKYNNSSINVLALPDENVRRKAQAHGLKPTTAEIIFIVYDEASEFDRQKDFYYINFGVRSKNELERYTFYISNPINKEHYFVKRLEKSLVFNAHKLKNPPYYQLKTIDKTFILYNNYLFIKDSLTTQIKDGIIKGASEIPYNSDMILYGLPGATEASIFSKMKNSIKYIDVDATMLQNALYYSGLDFGYTKDATALCLWALLENGDILLLQELYLETYKSNSIENDDLKIALSLKEWFVKYPNLRSQGLSVFCDHDNIRMANINNKIPEINASVIFTYKWPLGARISWWSSKISQHKVKIGVENSNFVREILGLEWDNTKKVPTPLPGNDHIYDAASYAFCNKMEQG